MANESGVSYRPIVTVRPPLPPTPPPVTIPPPPVAPPAEPSTPTASTVTSATPVTSKRVTGATKTETRYRTTKTQETVVHTLSDNGTGGLGAWGTANYAGKSLNVKLLSLDSTTDGYKSDHEDSATFDNPSATSGTAGSSSSAKGGGYVDNAMSEQLLASSTVTVTYSTGSGAEAACTHSFAPPEVTIDLCPYTSDYIVPGSVRFTWMGQVFEDYDGLLVRGRSPSHPGYVAGQLNYSTGIATVTDYTVSGLPTAFSLDSLWTIRQNWNTASVFFRTEVAPLKSTSLVMTVTDSQGNVLTASAAADGTVTGTHAHGRIAYQTGEVEVQYGDYLLDSSLSDAQKAEWWYDPALVGAVQADKIWRPWPVDPTTLRYSCVSFVYLPVNASLMGLDPAALPPDGRVAFAIPGDTCVVGLIHGGPAFAAANGLVYNTGHERLSFVQVLNAETGAEIFTGYTADLDAGTVAFTDIAGYPAQVNVVGRTEVYRQIAEVRIDGRVRLTQPIGYGFPAGAVFSTALRQGDRFARVSRVYDQASWNGTKWHDGVDPDAGPATATYNSSGAPVEVANRGAITERWALRMRSDGITFDCHGQHLGLIASGTINADFSPMNVAAGAPYMTVRAAGWNAGWVAGNTLFIDTVGAGAPVAVVRATQPGAPVGLDDSFWIVQRGDVARDPGSSFD